MAYGDHFYTISQVEHDEAVTELHYVDEGIACFVLPPEPVDETSTVVSLLRLFNPKTGDHFYTVSQAEHDSAIADSGYSSEGIACNVFRVEEPGTVALHRLYDSVTGDHFYTTSDGERDSAIAGGYASEGDACWVFGGQFQGTVSFLRAYRPFDALIGINVILVGDDGFSQAQLQQTEDSLDVLKSIYAKVGLGVDNVEWWGITEAQAGGYVVIDNNSEAANLTHDWKVKNASIDMFVVVVFVTDDGYSPIPGPCQDKEGKEMHGSVVSLNGDTANSGNTFAHEVGHYLGLNHVKDTGNFIGGNGSSDSWTGIFQWQGVKMKQHCLVRRI